MQIDDPFCLDVHQRHSLAMRMWTFSDSGGARLAVRRRRWPAKVGPCLPPSLRLSVQSSNGVFRGSFLRPLSKNYFLYRARSPTLPADSARSEAATLYSRRRSQTGGLDDQSGDRDSARACPSNVVFTTTVIAFGRLTPGLEASAL